MASLCALSSAIVKRPRHADLTALGSYRLDRCFEIPTDPWADPPHVCHHEIRQKAISSDESLAQGRNRSRELYLSP